MVHEGYLLGGRKNLEARKQDLVEVQGSHTWILFSSLHLSASAKVGVQEECAV